MICKDGMTIKELKDLLDHWPTENQDGTDTKIWIHYSGNKPIPVTMAYGIGEKDLLLEH